MFVYYVVMVFFLRSHVGATNTSWQVSRFEVRFPTGYMAISSCSCLCSLRGPNESQQEVLFALALGRRVYLLLRLLESASDGLARDWPHNFETIETFIAPCIFDCFSTCSAYLFDENPRNTQNAIQTCSSQL